MGRPKKYHERRVTTAVRLPERLHRELETTADDRDTSINHLMVKAAEFYLRHLPRLEPVIVVDSGTQAPFSSPEPANQSETEGVSP